jgi:hypothetical protein
MPVGITAILVAISFNYPMARHNMIWLKHETVCIVKTMRACKKGANAIHPNSTDPGTVGTETR